MSYITDYGQTILPLDWWRQAMGIDPYHFWQMTYTNHPMQGYSHIYPQRRWQYTEVNRAMPTRDAKRGLARYDVVQAILRAEDSLARFAPLNAYPGPVYTENEKVVLQKPQQTTMYRVLPWGLMTKWHHIQFVGTRTFTLIEAGVTLTYAGDDVTCTVTTTAVADEVVVRYSGETVEIRPVEVTKSGNVATITLKRWQCADPNLWDAADPIDATDVTNLIDTVDVYRRWIDPSAQITLAWEPDISQCGCLDTDNCAACQQATRTACAIRRNYKVGHVGWQTATYNTVTGEYDLCASSCCWPYNRFPEYAYISYLHGFSNENQRYMSQKWVQIVTGLAAAFVPNYVTDVTTQPDILYYWREDLAVADDKGKHRNLDMGDLMGPFGTRRGQVEAWREVKLAIGD